MIVRIIKFEENKILNHVVNKIKEKLLQDKKINISESDIEDLSQEIVLTSESSYLEILDILTQYLEVSSQKKYGLARSIKGLLDEYNSKERG